MQPRTMILDTGRVLAYSEGMDWKSCVTDLEAAGFSLRGLARKLGCSPSTLVDLKKGRHKQPTGLLAVNLLQLHRRHKRKEA